MNVDKQNLAQVIAEAGLPDLAPPRCPWRAPSGSQGARPSNAVWVFAEDPTSVQWKYPGMKENAGQGNQ